MSSIILVNDLFEELREENERLKQTIDLMVKYRKCLIGFRDNCNCDANDCNKLLVQLLEEKWTQLEDNDRHQRSQHPPVINRPSSGNQTDVIDVKDGGESDGEDVAESIDEELISTADTSKTLRSTTVMSSQSTPQLTDSIGKSKPRLKCSESGCDLTFVHHLTLNKHLKIHKQLNLYSCSLSPNTSRSPEQLESHNNSSHSVPISGQRLSAIDENRERNRCRLSDGRGYQCHRTDCRRVLATSNGLTNHMRTHRGDYRFGCNECHKKFVDFNGLVTHKKYLHIKYNTNAFKCQYTGCHYKTNKRSHLLRHQLNHENNRSFKCPITGCDYRTNTNDNLRKHKVTKHGFKRH